MNQVSFGAEFRRLQYGCLDEDKTFLNHGSYGVCPKDVFQQRMKFLDQCESHPDEWMRHESQILWLESVKKVAQFINTDIENVTLIPSPTAGINAIFRSIQLIENDIVLATSDSYPMVKNCCSFYSKFADRNVTADLIQLPLPITDKSQVVDAYKDYFDSHPNVKLTIVDVITSPTGMLLPIKEIIKLCNDRGVLVALDGAHACGQVDIDINQLPGLDFFVGAFYKWFFSPRGCSIMYVHPKHQADMVCYMTGHIFTVDSRVLSHPLHVTFCLCGVADNTPYMVVPRIFNFIDSVGGLEAIRKYSRDLGTQVIDYLVQEWKTEALPIPHDMTVPFMRVVRLPDRLGLVYQNKTLSNIELSRRFAFYLYSKKNLQVTTISRYLDKWWLRLSFYLYNTFDDYVKLNNVITSICEEGLTADNTLVNI